MSYCDGNIGYKFYNCTLAKYIEIKKNSLELKQAIESKLNDNFIGIESRVYIYKNFLSSSK